MFANPLTAGLTRSNLPTSQLYSCNKPHFLFAGELAVKISLSNNKLIVALAPLALAALTLSACGEHAAPAPAIRPALTYKIGTQTSVDSDVYAGEIRARIEADHAFRVGGKIAKRLVDTGAVVKKGQTLALLDPQDVRLAADAANAQVLAQQTDHDYADAELKRYQDLFNKGFVSKSVLDQKMNLAKAADARLEAVRAQAKVTLNQAGYAALVAETDGVVTQILAEAGQVVSTGQPVMRIADPRERELSISAPEARIEDFRKAANKTAPRQLMVFTWNQPDKPVPAVIREIGGAADPVTRTYPVRLTLVKADQSIQLGMSAYAVFIGADATGSFAVPLSSLYVQGEQTGVWLVAADGKVSLKPVKVLSFRETSALIQPVAGNIKLGDVIVAAGVHKLREGEVVKPTRDPYITGDGKVAVVPAPAGTNAPRLAGGADPVSGAAAH